MRKVTGRIKGLRKVEKSSYEYAYDLREVLVSNLHRFLLYQDMSTDNDLIIYPSAWYDNFFELTLRDKNFVECNQKIDSEKLMDLVEENMPCGWICYNEHYHLDGGCCCSPVVLKFRFEGVN